MHVRLDQVGEHHQPRGDALQDGLGVGEVAWPVGPSSWDAFVRRARQQHRQVVGQDLGRHVDQRRVLAEAGDCLQVQAMLQAFERFLVAPSLLVARAEAMRRGLRGGEVGHQHPRLAIGGDLPHHAHGGAEARALPGGSVLRLGGGQGDMCVELAALDDAAQADSAATAVVAAHDELDAALVGA